MTHSTHVTFTLIAASALHLVATYTFGHYTPYQIALAFIMGSIVGSLIPDLDEPESFIGKRFAFGSFVISRLVKHRGASHFFIVPIALFVVSIGLLFFKENQLYGYSALGVSFGYLMHIIGDMLTLSGIRYVYFPFGSKGECALLPRYLRFRTGSIKEDVLHVLLSGILFLNIYLLVTLGGLA